MIKFALAFLAFTATGCLARNAPTSFEELSYTVEEVYNKGTPSQFEKRHYVGGRNFACTNTSLYDDDVTKEEMFAVLEDYLEGENDEGATIPLALPVTYVRDLTPEGGKSMLCVFLGEALNESPPSPVDSKVALWEPSEKVIYTRTVGSLTTKEQWADEYNNLRALLEANGKGSEILTHVTVYAVYTPTWLDMEDKNEVWIFKNIRPQPRVGQF